MTKKKELKAKAEKWKKSAARYYDWYVDAADQYQALANREGKADREWREGGFEGSAADWWLEEYNRADSRIVHDLLPEIKDLKTKLSQADAFSGKLEDFLDASRAKNADLEAALFNDSGDQSVKINSLEFDKRNLQSANNSLCARLTSAEASIEGLQAELAAASRLGDSEDERVQELEQDVEILQEALRDTGRSLTEARDESDKLKSKLTQSQEDVSYLNQGKDLYDAALAILLDKVEAAEWRRPTLREIFTKAQDLLDG